MTRAELDAIRARADEHHRIPTVMAADRRDLLDYVDKLLAVIERCASECAECGGSGQVPVQACCGRPRSEDQCCGSPDMEPAPCFFCADIREALPG